MPAAPVVLDPEFDAPREIAAVRTRADTVFRSAMVGAGVVTLLLMGLIGLFLFLEGRRAISITGWWSFLTTFEWRPDVPQPKFGIGAVMYGTVVIAVIALAIAVPVGIATALFVNEYAPTALRRPLTATIDLLASIPSLIYGLWGRSILQPHLMSFSEFLSSWFGWIPIFRVAEGRPVSSSPFIAGVVVSLMVIPICSSVMREVFAQTPPGEKEGALALGATRWGMIRTVVLPFGRGGIIGGSMLGLGRALGETIAVALIISPIFTVTPRILESGGNSIAALIALRFSESQQVGLSALMAAGFVLFMVTLVVNLLASVVVSRSRSGAGVEL